MIGNVEPTDSECYKCEKQGMMYAAFDFTGIDGLLSEDDPRLIQLCEICWPNFVDWTAEVGLTEDVFDSLSALRR